jgi:hypothetical protein
MKKYDLSEFVKEQSTEPAVIVLGDREFSFKNNAWAFVKLTDIQEKHANNRVELMREMIKTFLGEDALSFLETLHDSAKLQVINVIVSEISGEKIGSDFVEVSKKK